MVIQSHLTEKNKIINIFKPLKNPSICSKQTLTILKKEANMDAVV